MYIFILICNYSILKGETAMQFSYLDREEYKDIKLLRMTDNNHGDLPIFIRKYSMKDYMVDFHRHEYMQINYICHGKGKHYVNNHGFDIIKGDIFVIPPYVPHSISAPPDSSIEIYEFEFEPDFINQNFQTIENVESFFDFAYIEPFLVSENRVKPRLNLVGNVQVEVESILAEVLNEYCSRRSGYMLMIKSLLLKLLVLVGREFTRELENSESRTIFERHRDAIAKSIKFLNEFYLEDLSVEEVSKKFMLSKSYYSYLFKSITSKTFIEYLNGIRISKAMELLKSTDKRVVDICYDIGFNNVNHFNRLFRQQTGMSPLEYRKSG